jgi:hypothetical protein
LSSGEIEAGLDIYRRSKWEEPKVMRQLTKIFPMAYAKRIESVKLTMPNVVSPWGTIDLKVLIFGDSVAVAQFAQVGIELRHVELQVVRPEPERLVYLCLSDQVYAKPLLGRVHLRMRL